MITNIESSRHSFLNLMEDSEFDFHLSGSHFFENSMPNPRLVDIEFSNRKFLLYVTDGEKLVEFLTNNGFVKDKISPKLTHIFNSDKHTAWTANAGKYVFTVIAMRDIDVIRMSTVHDNLKCIFGDTFNFYSSENKSAWQLGLFSFADGVEFGLSALPNKPKMPVKAPRKKPSPKSKKVTDVVK